MYDLPYYKANDQQEVLAFMKAHPFITLCGADKHGSPVATHVPVLLVEKEERLFLRGHVMRKTDHLAALQQNNQVLAIFSGAHHYVSASLYENKQVGSTWNYKAVHAAGTIHFGDNEMLHSLLTDLTNHFENDAASLSLVKDMPESYVQQLMKAIIVFEIAVTDIRHVFKLSQNRDELSRENIIQHLEKHTGADAQQVAKEMKDHYAAAAKKTE